MTAWLKDVIGYGLHAARPAAGSAGALYYETDTDTLLRDNGTTWDALTLGSASPLTTKGDVFVHGSSDARLAVGTDGQVLTADSTQTLGVKWATAGGGGSGALTKISETALTSAAANFTFSDIAATYRHLRLRLVGRGSASAASITPLLQFNGDTTANYERSFFQSYTTGTSEAHDTGQTSCSLGIMPGATVAANVPGFIELNIFDYARTNWYKVCCAFTCLFSGGYNEQWVSGIWKNTAAITSILLAPDSGNWVAGTVATLYGVS